MPRRRVHPKKKTPPPVLVPAAVVELPAPAPPPVPLPPRRGPVQVAAPVLEAPGPTGLVRRRRRAHDPAPANAVPAAVRARAVAADWHPPYERAADLPRPAALEEALVAPDRPYTIVIVRNTKMPSAKLADVEIHFTHEVGALAGLRLVGFAIWEATGQQGQNVTVPTRPYHDPQGQKRNYKLIRPIGGEGGGLHDYDALRGEILRAYLDTDPGGIPT